MTPAPPDQALKFLRWFCREDYLDEIEGDLTEIFIEQFGASPGKAKRKFIWQVLRYFRPEYIKSLKSIKYNNPTIMFRHNIISAIRNLKKNLVFSLINIIGLSIGLAAFILITLYVYHELSYDRYNKKADRIYRIVENLRTENELLLQSTSSPPMGPALKRDFPEVVSYVRFNNFDGIVRVGDKAYYETDLYLADSTVFDIFTWPLIEGKPKTALTEPNTVVITQSIAKIFFGDKDPVGEMINVAGDDEKITGVMKDLPENSHFRVNILSSWSTWSSHNKSAETDAWGWNGFHTYLLLAKGNGVAESLRSKMHDFIKKNIKMGGMYYEDLPLQPLTSIYLATPRSWEDGPRGNMNNIYILSAIAVFILLIACFNYINMATARAMRRMKEVGLKKVLGVHRRSLVGQFMGESLIVSMIATLIGFIIAWIFLPEFNELVDGHLHFSIFPGWYWIAGGLLLLILFLGFLAGFYPAFMISGFRPMQIFRPHIREFFGHNRFRKVLVTSQFVISIMLVAGTALIFNQLKLVRNQDLGFNKQETIILPFYWNDNVQKHLESVKNEIQHIDGVNSVTASATVPGESTNNLYTEIEMQDGKMSPTNINTNWVDYDFIPSYGIQLLAGRNFSPKNPADDTTAFIINETGMKDYGWKPEDAIGKNVNQQGKKGTIIGVVKDFHYRSLHYAIAPLLLEMGNYGQLSIKIHSGDIPGVVKAIGDKWKSLAPGLPYRYSFLNQDYDRLYKADSQLGKVSTLFSLLALLVGCLGLLGLTSFSIERRVKEIGIRKVLGATISHVILLISKEFVWLIGFSFIIAVPVTYFLIQKWLRNFTDHIVIGPVPFILAGLSVLAFAWLSVSLLSFRAATRNPTVALKNE